MPRKATKAVFHNLAL